MNKLTKLIFILIICTTSIFAEGKKNTYNLPKGAFSGGFNSPIEAFNFYYKLAEEAKEYYERKGDFDEKHINLLAPHIWLWATNPDLKGVSKLQLSRHIDYIKSVQLEDLSIPDMKHSEPFYGRGDKRRRIVTITYTYFKYQQEEKKAGRNKRFFEVREREIGNKKKWFLY